MDEPTTPQPETMQSRLQSVAGKNPKGNKILMIVLAILLAASLGLNAWLYMQNMQSETDKKKANDEKAAIQVQLDDLKAKSEASASEETSASCTYTPGTVFKSNIKDALDSENTAAFATYTTNPVTMVLAGTEFGRALTPDEAATQMAYTHSATSPWDFGLSAATIASYEAGFYTDYFGANTLVGKASSDMVIAFDFNCDGSKINKIFISASEDMLL